MAIIQNRSQGHAVTSDIANATYVVVDFAVPNGTIETVTGFAITKIFWTGDWTIKRANTVVFQTANNTGVWDLNTAGISLTNSANAAANLSINTTSSAASLILGISKTSSTTANTW
jgi:hypothetical protein